MAAKKLLNVSKEEQRTFLNSFDTVLCDVDGVLWDLFTQEIEGTEKGIKALRNLGKKLYFVTNNSTAPLNLYLKRLEKFEAVQEEVIRPANAVIWYLKKINFDKELYVLGFKALKDELKNAGFKVVSDEIAPMGETADDILRKINDIRPNVGAILLDFVVNMDYMILQKCVEYISKNNALFLAGAWDSMVPYRGYRLIGSSYFAKAIEDVTGISPKILSKPGKEFGQILHENIGPYDPKKILFIGDFPETDMKFATDCGYQKIIPFTGYIKEKDLENWTHDGKHKPDYVVDSIKDFETIVDNLGINKNKL